ncbi:hypothetical protein [Psychrobacter sp. DAB_AL43B]|uniref:hypothetical protein n=1 Tax=Psychrobacter sp. DAB_AL43B TaxID=1028416 RepID=UPI0011AB7DC4|nr:hypothetical protein [Psychrobacter sp. DAB_AL43B]
MSTTEIYGFNADGYAEFIGETQNAWRGCMEVWTALEDKYLEPLPPFYEGGGKRSRLHSIMNIEESTQAIWDLADDQRLTDSERITLKSTLDYMVVKSENIESLISAYQAFDTDADCNTTLKEQAEIIEQNKDQYIAFGFNQTSVNSAFWTDDRNTCECEYCEHCKEDYYNLNTESEHFNIFDELNEGEGCD